MSAAIASLEGSVRLQVVRKGELIYDKDDGNQATAYCKTLVLWGIMNDGVVGSYPEHGGPNYVRCTSQTTGDATGQVFAANADTLNSGRDIGNTGINVVTLTSHTSDAGTWQSIDTVVDGSNSSANKMVFELEANNGSSAAGYAPGKCADHIHTIGASETLQIGDKYRVIWTLTV